MNTNGRIKFVKKLRSSIAIRVDKEKWENLSNGVIAKIQFQENVNTILSDFYKYIKNSSKEGKTKSVRKVIRSVIHEDNEKNDIETYSLITEMLPLDQAFENDILPSAYKKCNDDSVSECKKTIVRLSVKFYEKEFAKLNGSNIIGKGKILSYVNKFEKLIKEIVKEAEDSAYTEYIESLNDAIIEADSYTIGLISDKLNRDIYFIDSRTRMPYRDSGKDNLKKRTSIVVIWNGGCHYEIVGRLMAGNRIQREFEYKDPLIKCLYTYLCYPEKIPMEYPNLVEYMTKDIRKKIGYAVSDDYNSKSHKHSSDDDDYEKSSEYEKSDSDNE